MNNKSACLRAMRTVLADIDVSPKLLTRIKQDLNEGKARERRVFIAVRDEKGSLPQSDAWTFLSKEITPLELIQTVRAGVLIPRADGQGSIPTAVAGILADLSEADAWIARQRTAKALRLKEQKQREFTRELEEWTGTDAEEERGGNVVRGGGEPAPEIDDPTSGRSRRVRNFQSSPDSTYSPDYDNSRRDSSP